jgi:phosphonate transport system substrate-binding protein
MTARVRFGVSRSHGREHLQLAAQRFSAVLAEQLQQPVRTIVTDDYEQLLEGVLVAGIDLAWMPPLLHTRASEEEGLLACVSQRDGSVTYRTALLVRADAGYRSLAQLRGARAAWTDRASSSGYLFPRLQLLAEGLDPVRDLKESLVGSAQAAMAKVVDQKADLCACFVSHAAGGDPERALRDVARIFPPAATQLRVLAVSEAIPPDGVVLAPAIDGRLQARLRDLLLQFHQNPAGTKALAELFDAERLVPVTLSVSRALDRLRALAATHL